MSLVGKLTFSEDGSAVVQLVIPIAESGKAVRQCLISKAELRR